MDSKKNEFEGFGLVAKWFRSIAKFFSNIAQRFTYYQYLSLFGQRDDDIYIVTYPKSGTTMMQMICYCLTTEGKMDFNHIYDVSPWVRNDVYMGRLPRVLPSPRIIKSHDKHTFFEGGTKGRFIFVYRDGMDVAVSLFHQEKNYNKPDLEFPTFLERYFKGKGWFKFCQLWFKNKKKFPILYLKYEDLIDDKEAHIEKIISFLKIKPSKAQVKRALEYSSFDYMKKHEDKFGIPKPPEKKYDNFIRKGKKGEGTKVFSEKDQRQFLELKERYLDKLESKRLS